MTLVGLITDVSTQAASALAISMQAFAVFVMPSSLCDVPVTNADRVRHHCSVFLTVSPERNQQTAAKAKFHTVLVFRLRVGV